MFTHHNYQGLLSFIPFYDCDEIIDTQNSYMFLSGRSINYVLHMSIESKYTQREDFKMRDDNLIILERFKTSDTFLDMEKTMSESIEIFASMSCKLLSQIKFYCDYFNKNVPPVILDIYPFFCSFEKSIWSLKKVIENLDFSNSQLIFRKLIEDTIFYLYLLCNDDLHHIDQKHDYEPDIERCMKKTFSVVSNWQKDSMTNFYLNKDIDSLKQNQLLNHFNKQFSTIDRIKKLYKMTNRCVHNHGQYFMNKSTISRWSMYEIEKIDEIMAMFKEYINLFFVMLFLLEPSYMGDLAYFDCLDLGIEPNINLEDAIDSSIIKFLKQNDETYVFLKEEFPFI